MLQKNKRYFDVGKGDDITKNAPQRNQSYYANERRQNKIRNKRQLSKQIITHDLSKKNFRDQQIEKHQKRVKEHVKRLHRKEEIRGKVSRNIRKLN